jgi:hypothetical protein
MILAQLHTSNSTREKHMLAPDSAVHATHNNACRLNLDVSKQFELFTAKRIVLHAD